MMDYYLGGFFESLDRFLFEKIVWVIPDLPTRRTCVPPRPMFRTLVLTILELCPMYFNLIFNMTDYKKGNYFVCFEMF